MNTSICIENNRIRLPWIAINVFAAFLLSACSDSGSGNGQQSQADTASTANTEMPGPESTDARSVTAEPEMPEPTKSETPMPGTPEPETSMSTTGEGMTATGPKAAGATETAEAPATVDGGQVYNTYCAICHKLGMNAAPKYGNKALWQKRIAQGRETVYKHAIEGLRGMPPRGGFANLSDEEVKAAVDYMVRGSGGWGDS